MALFFNVGDLFYSFAELKTKLNDYKLVNCVEFGKRDARTICGCKEKVGKELKPELTYYEIKYFCIHGGQPFKATAKGIRSTYTFKCNCPAHITLHVNVSDSALEVKSVSNFQLSIATKYHRMVRNYKQKGTTKKWKEEDLRRAIEFAKTHKNIRLAGREFGIPQSTLRDHMKVPNKSMKPGHPTVLTSEQEQEIVDTCLLFAQWEL